MRRSLLRAVSRERTLECGRVPNLRDEADVDVPYRKYNAMYNVSEVRKVRNS